MAFKVKIHESLALIDKDQVPPIFFFFFFVIAKDSPETFFKTFRATGTQVQHMTADGAGGRQQPHCAIVSNFRKNPL